MEYVTVVSLNEPIFHDEGRPVSLADLLEDEGASIEDRWVAADFVNRLPVKIRSIGAKMVDGTTLTPSERKRLQRFREKCPCRDAIGQD